MNEKAHGAMRLFFRRLFFGRGRPDKGPLRVTLRRAFDLQNLAIVAPAYLRIHTKAFGEPSKRKATALIRCPSRHLFALGEAHEIDDAGMVDPVVSCPGPDPGDGCDWTAHVTLGEWA